jgi:ATP-dependent Lhr-like helicase
VLDKEISQDVHHGSLSKEVRVKNEGLFKNQHLKALVATSSLELGIDIGSVDLVMQYLSPRQVTKMIQRIGRSGHKAGEKSLGILLTDKDDVFESAVINKGFSQRKLEPTRLHENALDVLAHQIVGMALDEYGVQAKEIFSTMKKSYCFRNLTKKEFDSVLDFLASSRLVFVDQKTGEVRRSRRCWQYYFENLSTIPDTRQYLVVDMTTNEPIGSLDETFVAEHCLSGNSFICKGRGWKVVETEKNRVLVEPFDHIESAIPSWEGELIPVPRDIAAGVGQLRRIIAKGNYENDNLKKEYGIDDNSLKEMKRIMESQKSFFIPDEKSIFIETYQDFIIIHCCAGSLINDALGRYISSSLNIMHGVSVQMKTSPYSIIIKTVGNQKEIEEILKNPDQAERIITDSLESSSLFRWRFVQAAKRFGIVERGAFFDKINVSKLITFYRRSPVFDETMREILLEKTDISGAMNLLESIKKKEVGVRIFSNTSPLGKQSLIYQFGELIAPKEPTGEIFKLFKRRLLNTQVMLACMNCGKFSITKRVSDVEQDPECQLCGSRLMAVLNKSAETGLKMAKKKLSGKPVSKADEKEFERIRRTADLTIVYGRKAVMILAARGIGAETASRILSKLSPTEEQLLKEIFEAEKIFARTHKYWK